MNLFSWLFSEGNSESAVFDEYQFLMESRKNIATKSFFDSLPDVPAQSHQQGKQPVMADMCTTVAMRSYNGILQ